jgi:hypothetical protein
MLPVAGPEVEAGDRSHGRRLGPQAVADPSSAHPEMVHAASLRETADQCADLPAHGSLVVGAVGVHVPPLNQQQELARVLDTPAHIHRHDPRYGSQHPDACVIHCTREEELQFDVITELWFQDEAVFRGTVKYLATSIMPDEVVEDEKQLFDRARTRMATVVECESALIQ